MPKLEIIYLGDSWLITLEQDGIRTNQVCGAWGDVLTYLNYISPSIGYGR